MGRKARRAVYDPSIMDRVDASPMVTEDPDPLALTLDSETDDSELDVYEQEHQEILDPKLHGTPRKRGKCQRACLWFIVCSGVIGIITAVSIVIARSNKGGSSSSTQAAYLPPVPGDISTKCNFVKKSHGNLVECEEVCEAAECCEYPPDLPLSCLNGNEDICMQYHKGCSVLYAEAQDATILVPKAPADLAQVCTPESLATSVGYRQCLRKCSTYECCYKKGVNSCTDQPTCAGYSPCLNIEVADNKKEGIEATISDLCTQEKVNTPDGKAICVDACQMAYCCFQGEGQCPQSDTDFCNQYHACGIVFTGDKATETKPFDPATKPPNPGMDNGHPKLPPVPQDMDVICDEDFFDDDDSVDRCRAACKASACCNFPPNQKQSCLGGNEAACLTYHKSCAALANTETTTGDHIDNIEPVDNLNVLCSPNSLATASGLEACMGVCKQAECCWKVGVPRCPEQERCVEFAPCLNIRSQTHTADSIKTMVDQKCAADKLATVEGRAVCDSICKQHRCCFTDEPFCKDSSEVCQQYASCKPLYTEELTEGHKTLRPPPVNLEEVCEEGFVIVEDDDDDFDDDDDTFTDDYDDDDDWDDDDNIELEEEAAARRQQCKDVCERARCCNYPPEMEVSCLKGNHDTCLQYHTACSVLQWGEEEDTSVTIQPADSLVLNDECSTYSLANDAGRQRCRDQCDPVDCCWDTEENLRAENKLSCRNNENCGGYGICLNLRAYDKTDKRIKDEVDEKCTFTDAEGALREPRGAKRAICDAVCQQRMCCWTGGPETCAGEPICEQYRGCKMLYIDEIDDDDFNDDDDDDGFDDDAWDDDDAVSVYDEDDDADDADDNFLGDDDDDIYTMDDDDDDVDDDVDQDGLDDDDDDDFFAEDDDADA